MNKKIKNDQQGTLYIVPTPIGNLQDISYRALHVLQTVQLIIAENTIYTKNLLKKFNINTHIISFYKDNEDLKINKIITLLNKINIALVSDAGTPTINDPGYRLINSCHKNNITVVPLPGPCALITALSASGLPSHEFLYKGFLPKKLSQKICALQKIKNTTITTIFYESCHRIVQSIQNIINILGDNKIIVLAKEITKKWENIKYDTAINIFNWLKKNPLRQKGEMVILIKGHENKKKEISLNAKNTLSILSKEISIKSSIQLTAKIFGMNKNILYKYVMKNLKNDKK